MLGQARECRLLRNVRVPMRDGAHLATSVYLPNSGGPFPVVLVRTAYNRVPMHGVDFARRGMAMVVQDCRGRYDSQGEWYPFIHEADDGADTLEWLHARPWCNGRVGMFGDSYLAATQFYAALAASDKLTALNPRFMAGDCWKRAYYCDGVFSLALTWSWLCFECSASTSEAAMMPLFDVREMLERLPLASLDEACGAGRVQSYHDYATSSEYGPQWEPLNVRAQFAKVAVPMLLTGGWYDYYAGETFANFQALRENAPTPELRDSHRVIVGPWTHGHNSLSTLGELDFGPNALAENDATTRWLECMLKGGAPADFQRAPVRLFVMGANEWRDEHEWPLARTRYTDYYLREGGGLSTESPGDETPEAYEYDPADPVPTTGGNHSVGPYNPGLYELAMPGPLDQREVEARADVVVFTSSELDRDLEVTGPVVVTLFAASSAPDTDFVARLTDVHPNGRSINVTEGVIRARFRNGVWGRPQLMDPGTVYEFTIDLQATSMVFKRGHRIRLQVTSSNFPLWDRNLNTGADPAASTEMRVARQTIFHDSQRPSHIRLPVAKG